MEQMQSSPEQYAHFINQSTHHPTNQTLIGNCPSDDALGMSIDIDFSKGEVNSFAASGSPKYDSEGVSFTVARANDAPQLASLFYIMFGRVEITMKAAPGAGIVSSLVLQSDVLDEIDIEWLGSDNDEIQSNYFGKGQTTSYNRGEFHDVTNTQGEWITYTIDWTKDRIVWMAGGTVVRTLNAGDAEDNQYPQTPMQVKFGAWAGGDPNWGRIMCALGYSGARMIEEKTNIWYGDLPIVQQGVLASTPWAKLKAVAANEEFRVKIDLSIGEFSHTVWTTDLTEEYVRFNLGE